MYEARTVTRTLGLIEALSLSFANPTTAIQPLFAALTAGLPPLFPLLPAYLNGWDGGLADMRRDAGLLYLLTSAYFLFWNYWQKPSHGKALLLSVIILLAILSRGNSLPYLVCALVLPFLAVTLRDLKTRPRSYLLDMAFMAIAGGFCCYWILSHLYNVLFKYTILTEFYLSTFLG
jgi:hypothetical protein